MTDVLEMAPIARPAEAASEFVRLNERLARHRTIPSDVGAAVHDLAVVMTETALAEWDLIDPHASLVLHRAVIEAQAAVGDPESPAARDRLRVALESVRQALAAIAEADPVSDHRSAKEITQWLAETAEVSQRSLADVLGVGLRQLQRWLSDQAPTQPEGDDARRVRGVARVFNQLRFSLTPSGAIAWFDWPRDDLDGATPSEVLADPARLPELTAIAGSMRSTYAS